MIAGQGRHNLHIIRLARDPDSPPDDEESRKDAMLDQEGLQ
jgi:hypothetical protein